MSADTATERRTQRNQLMEDIDLLELEAKKVLLEKVKQMCNSNSTFAESFARAYVMISTGKLPGSHITTK